MSCSVSIKKSCCPYRNSLVRYSRFSLAAFKILSLSLNFAIMMYLGVGLFGFLLIVTLCASWTCVTFSVIQMGKFSIITFQTGFLSLAHLLLLLISLLYGYYYVLCCSRVPSTPLHSFWVFFPFLALSGSFFYFVLQLTHSIFCFITSGFPSIYSVVQFRNAFFILSWFLLIVCMSFFMLM